MLVCDGKGAWGKNAMFVVSRDLESFHCLSQAYVGNSH